MSSTRKFWKEEEDFFKFMDVSTTEELAEKGDESAVITAAGTPEEMKKASTSTPTVSSVLGKSQVSEDYRFDNSTYVIKSDRVII